MEYHQNSGTPHAGLDRIESDGRNVHSLIITKDATSTNRMAAFFEHDIWLPLYDMTGDDP